MKTPPNIFLVGFMGSGKTSTGKELSKILGFHFWDMDSWIEEKNGKKIPEIFQEHGEGFFRRQEEEAIQWLGGKSNFVVSTGGGSWINKTIREQFSKMGWCIWLKVSPEVMLQRVSSHPGQRPLLMKSKDLSPSLEKLLKERIPFYSLAQNSVETDGKSPKEVAIEIVEVLFKNRPFDLPPAR
jgi:shikimate kinase